MAILRRHTRPDEENAAVAAFHPHGPAFHGLALAMAMAAVILSAFHFWPLERSKLWQMVLPPNLIVLAWTVLMLGFALCRGRLDLPAQILPHVSLLVFLSLCLLSLAFARDMSRALNYSIKSCLMLGGGYTLLRAAMTGNRSIKLVLSAATLACVISTSGCLAAQYGFQLDRFGFFDNEYKYGTYTSVLSVLCGTYLVTATGGRRVAGAMLVSMASLSCATLGGLAGVTVGAIAFMLTRPGRHNQGLTAAAVILGAATAAAFPPAGSPALCHDLSLAETRTSDLRQRYLEWQAEINLLAERTVPGTGAGSINDYRSEHYGRLPKLNTLEAFDQNGWLACGAEIGVLGLVCFTWAVVAYFRIAVHHLTRSANVPGDTGRRLASACLAGLAAAGTANLFSSVHYNGVLIVFVLLLALISRIETVFEASSHASG